MNKRTWMSNILEVDTLKLTDIVWPAIRTLAAEEIARVAASMSMMLPDRMP